MTLPTMRRADLGRLPVGRGFQQTRLRLLAGRGPTVAGDCHSIEEPNALHSIHLPLPLTLLTLYPFSANLLSISLTCFGASQYKKQQTALSNCEQGLSREIG